MKKRIQNVFRKGLQFLNNRNFIRIGSREKGGGEEKQKKKKEEIKRRKRIIINQKLYNVLYRL